MRSRQIEAMRGRANALQNHVIDEYVASRLDRRSFLRLASIVGLGVPMGAAALSGCGTSPDRTNSGGGGKAGGQLRGGVVVPGQALDPILISDTGGNTVIGQVGEYLSLSNGQPELTPLLAESWKPNAEGTIWTFAVRQGVKFNNGEDLTARDIAYTFNRLADPENVSSATGMFKGVLSKGGVSALDDATVVFELEKPVGAFPWMVSSDNYNSYILPENYEGDWSKDWIGTGPWKLDEYNKGSRARFSRNPEYWGNQPIAESLEITLFEDQTALILAFQSGNIDFTATVGVDQARPIIDNPDSYTVAAHQASTHEPISLHNDYGPLKDKRVRRALALAIDREEVVDNILLGFGEPGNDSPFAPVHAITDKSVPQRTRDLTEAKKLLAEAGYERGFELPITVLDFQSIPAYAQYVQSAFGEIGVDVSLSVLDSATFTGDNRPGTSPQLDAVSAINNWGHRGVPNVFLQSQLRSDGPLNASRYKSDEVDGLIDDLVGEVDIQKQTELAGKIQRTLLEDTPSIYAYFKKNVTLAQKAIEGIEYTGFGNPRVANARRNS